MSNQPLDKGRAAVIVEKYATNQNDNNNQPIMKNRYATIGKATKWQGENGRGDNVELEIDTMPIGQTGSVKVFIFWDSESVNNQPQQQQPQQQPQQNYQPQQNGYQNGSRG